MFDFRKITERTGAVRLGLFAASLLSLGWGFQTMLLKHAPEVFDNPQEDMSFAWYVPLFSLYVLWRERKEILASVGAPSPWGLLLAVPSLAAGFLGTRGAQLRLEEVGFVGILLSLVWAFFGTKTVRKTAFPILFLLFCVPLATFLDIVTVHLRLFASATAYAMLKGFGADVVRRGTMLASASGSYAIDVAAPCSGLRSLFALMALTAGYAYFNQRTWLRRAILFALSVPIAIFGNIVRILTICFVAAYFSPKFATGFYHDYSGYVVFAIAIALMLAASGVIAKVGERIDGGGQQAHDNTGAGEEQQAHDNKGSGGLAVVGLLSRAVPVVMAAGTIAFMVYQAKTPVPEYAEAPKTGLVEIAGYKSEPVAVSEAERETLPKDTVLEKRAYVAMDGSWNLVTVVTGGRSKSSIHRPELCLPAQGFAMRDPRTVRAGGRPWRFITLGRGEGAPLGFAYTFFNQTGYATSSHVSRIFRDVWDRSVLNRIDRWVMITVNASNADEAVLKRFLERLVESMK